MPEKSWSLIGVSSDILTAQKNTMAIIMPLLFEPVMLASPKRYEVNIQAQVSINTSSSFAVQRMRQYNQGVFHEAIHDYQAFCIPVEPSTSVTFSRRLSRCSSRPIHRGRRRSRVLISSVTDISPLTRQYFSPAGDPCSGT